MGIFDALTNLSPEQNDGLLSLASVLLNNDPTRPTNFGAALGAFQQGMNQSRTRRQDEKLRDLQIRSGTADLEAQQRAQAQQVAIQQAAQESVIGGQFNPEAFISRVQTIDPLKAQQFALQFAKAQPKFDTKPQTAIGPDGKPFQYIVAENGEIKRLDGFLPRDELKLANLGGRDVAYNPYALQEGQTFQRTMTPGEAASNQIARANLGIAQQRLAMDRQAQAGGAKAPQGYRWTQNGQLEAIPGGPADLKASKDGVQRVQDARDVIAILDEAEPLLKKSTSSYIGAGADQVARAFGIGTSGGEAAAQLKVLQGLLVSKQPKMSGPQSDKDVQLYREMAGQIGDPTLPESTRVAAIKTIRRLSEKYLDESGSGSAKPANAAGGWSIKEVR